MCVGGGPFRPPSADFTVLLVSDRWPGVPKAQPAAGSCASALGLAPGAPHLCSPDSGSREWSAGWARCSCRTAPAGPRPQSRAPCCADGAATCRGSSTASTLACALRSSSASSEVGPPAGSPFPRLCPQPGLGVRDTRAPHSVRIGQERRCVCPLALHWPLGSAPPICPSGWLCSRVQVPEGTGATPGPPQGLSLRPVEVWLLTLQASVQLSVGTPRVHIPGPALPHRLPRLEACCGRPQVLPGEDRPEAAAACVPQGRPGDAAAPPRCRGRPTHLCPQGPDPGPARHLTGVSTSASLCCSGSPIPTAGVNTCDIITLYISAIKALRVLDPSMVVLEVACEPIRRYLR